MQIFEKKLPKNLVISKKSSTFAPAFDRESFFSRKTVNLTAFEKSTCSFEYTHPTARNTA